MQTLEIEIKDDYVAKIIDFLKLLPANVVRIKSQHAQELDDELLERIEDIEQNRVKTISRSELFDGI